MFLQQIENMEANLYKNSLFVQINCNKSAMFATNDNMCTKK